MSFASYTSKYTGLVYNYVAKHERSPVDEGSDIDFGVVDAKGRKVGMRVWRTTLHTLTLATEAPVGGSEILEAGKPLVYFEACAIGARNGESFGSATICVRGPALGAVQIELAERIERARKAAVKKWTKA